MSLSWLKNKQARIGLGAKRVIVSGAKPLDIPAGEDWRAAGSIPLRDAAAALVDAGETTLEEINRVTFVS